MENLKIEVLSVLQEREDDGKAQNHKKNTGHCGSRNSENIIRQLPKMSALDLAGIVNSRRRLEWTKEWLKKNQSEFLSKENILKEIQFRNNETYYLNCFLQITERQFRHLVTMLEPLISTFEPRRKRKFFSAEERIAITLKYLATGEFHTCRNYCIRASKPVILKMISDICLKMYETLKDQYVSLPKTDEQWQNIANAIQSEHKLPNCIGNLVMQQIEFHTGSRYAPPVTETKFKPSMIFTAIVDQKNNFMYVDIEKTKAKTYDTIYECSTTKQFLETVSNNIPISNDITQEETNEKNKFSYYFAGGGAMPVTTYMLNSLHYVPTSQDQSYCFGSVREIEYCFAMDSTNNHMKDAICILTNIFPILASPLNIDEENARKVILGCVALYNFLRKTDQKFNEQTEKMARVGEEEIIEDDCIMIGNEDEEKERMEFTPNLVHNSCFHFIKKQNGDTVAGLAKRKRLFDYITNLERK
ncbi:uncharacterized protein LOC119668444 [Teleopsis dalmanni]|uniref:uncharacterized protein LOC119668444 n=1 Tax=Teleopsis dalmanni TaxID=139649 RepID=UPI0018CC9815|nr:uncharacterized protein LOC119668444 [Teleopsis dalmanni]